jgi:hypothetical protein
MYSDSLGNKLETVLPHDSDEPEIFVDINNILNHGWEEASESEFIKGVKEMLIHEYSHFISNKEPIDVHGNIDDPDNPHVISRTGVVNDYLASGFSTKLALNGRLNEVLTELVAAYIQSRYMPKVEYKNESDIRGYRAFVSAFGTWVVAAAKEFETSPKTLIDSMFKHYFDPVEKNAFDHELFSEMPEDLQYGLLELLKPETDMEILGEYLNYLVRVYDVDDSEITNVKQYYSNVDPVQLREKTPRFPRSIQDYESLALQAFAEINWEGLNSVGKTIQLSVGVLQPKVIRPSVLEFKRLKHGRDFQVEGNTDIKWSDTNIWARPYSLNSAPVIYADMDMYANDKSWEKCSDQDFKKHVTDSVIHEFAHLISHNEHEEIHNDITEKELPFVVLRSGVKSTEVSVPIDHKKGTIEMRLSVGTRLNEVLTELVADMLHEKYSGPNKSKFRSGSYYNFRVMFDVIAIVISRNLETTPQRIKKSFLYGYFTFGNVTSDAFIDRLSEDVKLAYLELLKPETGNYATEWEYVRFLTSKYDISSEELENASRLN